MYRSLDEFDLALMIHVLLRIIYTVLFYRHIVFLLVKWDMISLYSHWSIVMILEPILVLLKLLFEIYIVDEFLLFLIWSWLCSRHSWSQINSFMLALHRRALGCNYNSCRVFGITSGYWWNNWCSIFVLKWSKFDISHLLVG